jgi:hypothetical protein
MPIRARPAANRVSTAPLVRILSAGLSLRVGVARTAAEDVPAHCRVSAILNPEIGFEVNLPPRWNRRVYMIGNGGHGGGSRAAVGDAHFSYVSPAP